MALTYTESATLMIDPTFRGRIKVGCLHYADYIFGEDPATVAHNTRIKWAQRVYTQPETEAQIIQPGVVGDSKVQAAGANISDADLQSAVETTVSRHTARTASRQS